MSDPDHDQAWKPNNRPQSYALPCPAASLPAADHPPSTVARNFMDELNSLFNLDNDLDTLDKTVSEKYRSPDSLPSHSAYLRPC